MVVNSTMGSNKAEFHKAGGKLTDHADRDSPAQDDVWSEAELLLRER